jgi:hypothetical protein
VIDPGAQNLRIRDGVPDEEIRHDPPFVIPRLPALAVLAAAGGVGLCEQPADRHFHVADVAGRAIFTVLTWLDEGRDFSHQQRLTQQVAFLLGGETAPGIVAKVVEEAPAQPLPPLPPDAFAKKIQLSVECVAEFLPPALRAARREVTELGCSDALCAPPPHGPPRLNQVA